MRSSSVFYKLRENKAWWWRLSEWRHCCFSPGVECCSKFASRVSLVKVERPLIRVLPHLFFVRRWTEKRGAGTTLPIILQTPGGTTTTRTSSTSSIATTSFTVFSPLTWWSPSSQSSVSTHLITANSFLGPCCRSERDVLQWRFTSLNPSRAGNLSTSRAENFPLETLVCQEFILSFGFLACKSACGVWNLGD